jgi:hypothetical protein
LGRGRNAFVDVASVGAFGRTREELDFRLGDAVFGSQDEPFLKKISKDLLSERAISEFINSN